jgi:hypothetical protein
LKDEPVKVSSVVVSNQKKAVRRRPQRNLNPLISNGNELVPNVTHVFSSSQNLFFYYEIYDPAHDNSDKNAVRLLSSVVFYKNNVKAYETPLVRADEVNVPDRKATAFELQVPLAQLKPGFYTCQVNVVDDAAGKFTFPRLALLVR